MKTLTILLILVACFALGQNKRGRTPATPAQITAYKNAAAKHQLRISADQASWKADMLAISGEDTLGTCANGMQTKTHKQMNIEGGKYYMDTKIDIVPCGMK